MLVVSITGESIRYGSMNVCTIDRIEDLGKARIFISRKYGLLFKDEPSVDKKDYKVYSVDGVKADLAMVVEYLEHIYGDGSH